MKDYKKIICLTAAVCLLGTAAFCGYHIYDHYAHEAEQTEAFEEIAAIVEQAQTEDSNAPEVPLTEEENVLAEYGELFLKNTDMVGWLSIAGTTLNYPVMQTPNEPNYYLKRNFDKEYSDLGTPYIQENCDITSSDNLIIYGHHIKGGKMFGALEDYKSQSFYDEHKTIQFDTLTERGEYEIVAVFKTVAYSSQGFRYYDFVYAENEEDFNAYIEKCKELAFYETGVNAEYGDRLITLSTCEYSAQNGRLVVVAKLFVCAFPASVLGRQKGDKTIMKNKILTAISTIMLFVPWTILPLRTFDWALESPVAEIMISCYAAFMIFSGIFTIVSYAKAKVQNNLMKIDLVVNSLYAVFGVIVFILMAVTKFS